MVALTRLKTKTAEENGALTREITQLQSKEQEVNEKQDYLEAQCGKMYPPS